MVWFILIFGFDIGFFFYFGLVYFDLALTLDLKIDFWFWIGLVWFSFDIGFGNGFLMYLDIDFVDFVYLEMASWIMLDIGFFTF